MTVPIYRAVCYRCFKPELTCICARLPCVSNRTQVLVLQHPRERLHPIGTARFAQLGLRRSAVHVAWNPSQLEAQLPAWLRSLPGKVGLLYPAAHASELGSVPVRDRPQHLLVLDGTWHTAKTLYRDKLWLRELPHFRLMPAQPGRYRLRREPQHDYVSTIEAVVEALRILEPETTGLDALLRAFDRMIDQQIALAQARTGPRRTRKRRRPAQQRNVPRALLGEYARLLIVYGESARSAYGLPQEFAYLVACAPANGALFRCLVRPSEGLPEPEHLRHMGLTAGDFDGACDTPGLRERWSEYLGRLGFSPLLAAWNQRTLDLLARVMQQPESRLSLKGAYRAVHGIDAYSLEQVVQQRGFVLPELGLPGRAGLRLAGSVAVARYLKARADRSGS